MEAITFEKIAAPSDFVSRQGTYKMFTDWYNFSEKCRVTSPTFLSASRLIMMKESPGFMFLNRVTSYTISSTEGEPEENFAVVISEYLEVNPPAVVSN